MTACRSDGGACRRPATGRAGFAAVVLVAVAIAALTVPGTGQAQTRGPIQLAPPSAAPVHSLSAMAFDRSSYLVQRSPMMRAAWLSFGSFVRGLLQRSIVLAAGLLELPHHVSHQSQLSGSEWMGTTCCA